MGIFEGITHSEEIHQLLDDAQSIYDNAKDRLKSQKGSTTRSLEKLDRRKVKAWSKDMSKFLDAFDVFSSVQMVSRIDDKEIDKAMLKKILLVILSIVMVINLTACSGLQEKVSKLGSGASEAINNLSEATSDGIEVASEFASDKYQETKEAISKLSLPDFQKGYEITAGFFGASVASLGGQAYVKSVANAIDDLQISITKRVSVAGTNASNAGLVAEEWTAGTFNIDAVARGSKIRAKTPESNKLGSPDVSLSDGTETSLKYYKTAEQSAKQQAKSYMERYREYKNSTSNPLSQDEWIKKNGIDVSTDADLYWSIYKGQKRVIPADQLDDAKAFLEKAIHKDVSKDSVNRKYVSEADIETLNNLSDRLKASDGTTSVPLTKADAEAIANAARDEKFNPAEYKITTANVITGKYIAKQAIKSGTTSALIQAAMVLGPEIYEIIQYGINNGELDKDQLLEAGTKGLSAAGDGFLKGSISNALIVLCKAGKLGAEYANPSPELIGTLTVLVIDSIRYGIMMANGKMTTSEYLDIMAEELFTSAGSLGTAALMGLLFPGASLAIMIGGLVGGLVVSAGYTAGKVCVLAMIDNSDVDMLVPISENASIMDELKEKVSMSLSDAISALKGFGKKSADAVTIKLYDATSVIRIFD